MLSRKTKRAWIGFTFIALILLAGITLLNLYFAFLDRERRLEEERANLRLPTPFVVEVERGTLERERQFSLVGNPWQETRVAAEVPGRVVSHGIEIGQRVEAGEAILQIEDRLAQIDADASDAAVRGAQFMLDDLARLVREAEGLLAQGSIPRSEFETLRRRLDSQEQELQRLQEQANRSAEILSRHTVRAPFSGVIVNRLVEEGDQVTPGQTLVELADLSRLRVVLHVSQNELSHFVVGEPLIVSWAHIRAEAYTATIRFLSPVANAQTGQFRVEAELANPDYILPGRMVGSTRMTLTRFPDTLLVPTSVITFRGRRTMVERMLAEGTEFVEVETGPEVDGFYPVFAGLKEGDRVMVR